MTDSEKKIDRLEFELRRARAERDERGAEIVQLRERIENQRLSIVKDRGAYCDLEARMAEAVEILGG